MSLGVGKILVMVIYVALQNQIAKFLIEKGGLDK